MTTRSIGLSRRALLGAAACALPAVVRSQTPAWPTPGATIKLVVPFPPGGSTDVIGRLLAQRLAELWSASVVIENKAGAAGAIGAAQVARAPADGSEILIASVSLATSQHLNKAQTFDPLRDVKPVSLVTTVPNVLVSAKKHGFRTPADLIAHARAHPGKLSFGSAGIGTAAHLTGEVFKRNFGLDMVHVPYRGTGPALNDILAGQLDFMFDILTAAVAQIGSGAVDALGVTAEAPVPLFPAIRPLKETTPQFELAAWDTWNAVLLPAATPQPIADKLSADLRRVLGEPAIREGLAKLGVSAVGSTGPELGAMLARDSERWGRMIGALGIKTDG
jgi:tripartite-type tricarboxylate transporter receptor subunit TctC